jgi:hypothetical protein
MAKPTQSLARDLATTRFKSLSTPERPGSLSRLAVLACRLNLVLGFGVKVAALMARLACG